MTSEEPELSSYLQYLPAIFQQGHGDEPARFLGRFLLAFEHVLSGLGEPEPWGLLEVVEGVPDKRGGLERYFDPRPTQDKPKQDDAANDAETPKGPPPEDPMRAPAAFLPWLASWVALTLPQDWNDEEQRRMISRIVPLYKLRGTKAGLEAMLNAYTNAGVKIEDEFNQFPHFFQVRLLLGTLDPAEVERKERIARAIIDQEKPAHTYYALSSEILETMKIGTRSTIGIDTLLSSRK